MDYKKIINIIMQLVLLQLMRYSFKSMMFLNIERNLLSEL